MKLTMITVLVLFCILILGCQEENMDKSPDERLMNSELIDTYSDIAIHNAIISQHTLFPYHFVKNGAELNELGQRDLAVLTSHFAKNGGHLNIRQLGASAELYQARVSAVREKLSEAGVDTAEPYPAGASVVREKLREAGIETARITTSDGMPGGSGMPSERVLIILEQESASVGTETSTTYSPEMK